MCVCVFKIGRKSERETKIEILVERVSDESFYCMAKHVALKHDKKSSIFRIIWNRVN